MTPGSLRLQTEAGIPGWGLQAHGTEGSPGYCRVMRCALGHAPPEHGAAPGVGAGSPADAQVPAGPAASPGGPRAGGGAGTGNKIPAACGSEGLHGAAPPPPESLSPLHGLRTRSLPRAGDASRAFPGAVRGCSAAVRRCGSRTPGLTCMPRGSRAEATGSACMAQGRGAITAEALGGDAGSWGPVHAALDPKVGSGWPAGRDTRWRDRGRGTCAGRSGPRVGALGTCLGCNRSWSGARGTCCGNSGTQGRVQGPGSSQVLQGRSSTMLPGRGSAVQQGQFHGACRGGTRHGSQVWGPAETTQGRRAGNGEPAWAAPGN